MSGYADPEILIATWLRDVIKVNVRADPQLPTSWPYTAPISLVHRGASPSSLPLSLDDVTLDVDTYAANADHARADANTIWAAMLLQLPRITFANGIFCQSSTVISAPAWAPDPKYRRTAAYRVILHGFTA